MCLVNIREVDIQTTFRIAIDLFELLGEIMIAQSFAIYTTKIKNANIKISNNFVVPRFLCLF